jgi:hypothetical protein
MVDLIESDNPPSLFHQRVVRARRDTLEEIPSNYAGSKEQD